MLKQKLIAPTVKVARQSRGITLKHIFNAEELKNLNIFHGNGIRTCRVRTPTIYLHPAEILPMNTIPAIDQCVLLCIQHVVE